MLFVGILVDGIFQRKTKKIRLKLNKRGELRNRTETTGCIYKKGKFSKNICRLVKNTG